MKDIKIIFFDVDGTLIDMNKKEISASVLTALQELKKRKIILCIATGRSPIALPHFEQVTFDAFLTFNGSYCFNQEHTIYKNPIPLKDISTIVGNATALNRPVAIATSNQTVANGKDSDMIEYFSFAHQEIVLAENFDEMINKEEIFQLMLSSRKEDYSTIMQNTSDAKIAAWWDRAVDIIPSSSGKGTGIAKILDYYGLDQSQALAFGDGNNDIEMLQSVGWGVAMANASDELMAVADEVIGHVADDGIYHYCKAQGLI
jgi:Cof subfamily protein (haloacid dehalogenase superfamily)